MSDGDKSLSRDDLFLLMKSYENSVTLNTTLLEQQKQLLEHQNEIIDKQKTVCDSVNKVLDKLASCAQKTVEVQEHLGEKITGLNESINDSVIDNTKTLSEMKINCEAHHSSLSKEHMGINIRTYFGYTGLVAVIISLIYLGIRLFTHLDTIDAIAKSLGVS